jgi:hypothetical protein
MSNLLETQVFQYQQWRNELRECIEAYQSWLEKHGHGDIQKSLRIYDIAESLKNDRLTLAFLAEFSRGKTELINAMFFSDFKQRLLPSDVGRTTMCPTEIFFDAADEPYVRLLPIESRAREESIASLKHKGVEWVKMRLDLGSHEDMARAMASLAQVKSVPVEEANRLGLMLDDESGATSSIPIKGGRVDIPAWRHALINFPHPLLKNGLVILDTPGLNALGTEPELTLSMIPSAHAVLFLLAMDTGVTRSDLEVWQRYVKGHVSRHVAVLNKIDLMWDDLNSQSHIDAAVLRQLDVTAETLGVARDHVIALSAQKALIARIRGDERLLTRSNIRALEQLIAEEIVPAKQEILRQAVAREIGGMVESSLATVTQQLGAAQSEIKEMSRLTGKNREMGQQLLGKLESDKKVYLQNMDAFRQSYGTVIKQGQALLASLDEERLNEMLGKSRKSIEGSWTTPGLMRSMQNLFDVFTRQSKKILAFATETRKFVDRTYVEFHQKYHFAQLTPPALNLERHVLRMHGLQEATERFCKDPLTIGNYKTFVVTKFYDQLVEQARELFRGLRLELDAWLKSAMGPLSMQLRAHQKLLEERVENLRKIKGDIGSLQERVRQLEVQQLTLGRQIEELTRIRDILNGPVPAAAKKVA